MRKMSAAVEAKVEKLHERAEMLMEDGNLKGAMRPLDEIIRVNDRYGVHNGEVHFKRALIHVTTGRFEFAEADLAKMLRVEPKSHDAAYLMGVIAEREGRLKEAEKWFRKSARMKPNFWIVKMKLKRY